MCSRKIATVSGWRPGIDIQIAGWHRHAGRSILYRRAVYRPTTGSYWRSQLDSDYRLPGPAGDVRAGYLPNLPGLPSGAIKHEPTTEPGNHHGHRRDCCTVCGGSVHWWCDHNRIGSWCGGLWRTQSIARAICASAGLEVNLAD